MVPHCGFDLHSEKLFSNKNWKVLNLVSSKPLKKKNVAAKTVRVLKLAVMRERETFRVEKKKTTNIWLPVTAGNLIAWLF